MRLPSSELEALKAAGLGRTMRLLEKRQGSQVVADGKVLQSFASNDYLGFSQEPKIAQAMAEGLQIHGVGSAASRLVSGTFGPHKLLEEKIAASKQAEAALVFSSGYATALGCIPAIVGKGDYVIIDKLAHACLIDACRLSGATLRVYPHQHLDRLESLLSFVRGKFPTARILVVTESVFSMDGDVCKLLETVESVERFDAMLWLDEAHGLGVFGERGMGLAEQENLQARIAFQMGTLSKSAGLSGGYVAASQAWIDLFVHKARSFVYSTAPQPALAHAACVAWDCIQSDMGRERRQMLRERMQMMAQVAVVFSPIIPLVLGRNEAALEASKLLEDAGFWVPAIRFPTVPHGKARLRISLSAVHPLPEIERLIPYLLGLR